MKTNINKKDLAERMSNYMGYSVVYSKKIIDDLIKCITNNVLKSKLHLKNFGTFELIFKNERMGRNPKTKEEFIIKKRKSLKFTSSKNFQIF